jgi:hypothetical protein
MTKMLSVFFSAESKTLVACIKWQKNAVCN